jgi:hypothetical protein
MVPPCCTTKIRPSSSGWVRKSGAVRPLLTKGVSSNPAVPPSGKVDDPSEPWQEASTRRAKKLRFMRARVPLPLGARPPARRMAEQL